MRDGLLIRHLKKYSTIAISYNSFPLTSHYQEPDKFRRDRGVLALLGLLFMDNSDVRIFMGDRFQGLRDMADWIDDLKAERMIHGERSHGPLDLKTDPRDFIEEGVEELIDFLNYWEFAMLQGRVTFCEWSELDEWVRMTLGALKEARITPLSPGEIG